MDICSCCHLPGEGQFLQALHPAGGRGSTPLAQCTAVSPGVNFLGNDQMLLWCLLSSHLLASRAPTCVFALKTQPQLNSAVTALGTTDVKSFPFLLLLPLAAFSSLQLFYNTIASKCSFAQPKCLGVFVRFALDV